MPKKISDLTAVSSLQSADKVEISRNGTSTVSRDLYDEFADNIENVSGLLWNVGVNATVSASALTIFLTQKDGASNPSTSINRSRISYRSTTSATGGYVIVDSIATTSTVISAGSTGGFESTKADTIYVYAINNAGTNIIGWITGVILDETELYTTTAEGGAGAADSRGILYATSTVANAAVRCIAAITITATTAGTWATNPTKISTNISRTPHGSTIELTTPNGHGSTANKIRRYSVNTTHGYDITYADSATNGMTLTINVDGTYSIFVSDLLSSGAAVIGLSINSANLTTSIVSLAASEFLVAEHTPGAGFLGSISLTRYFRKGDVIRAHDDGAPNYTGIYAKCIITRVS